MGLFDFCTGIVAIRVFICPGVVFVLKSPPQHKGISYLRMSDRVNHACLMLVSLPNFIP